MSKRKFDDIAENNYSGNKIAKITAADNSADACLQLINDDIAYIIVDFLKLSAESLRALSLTCSRWHNQIDAILDKDIQHYLPVSYKKCNRKRRNQVIERFMLLRSEASVDLQLFEFPEIATESPIDYFQISHMNAIPWAPHIAFVRIRGGYVIVDLNKCQYVVQEAVPKQPAGMGNSLCQLYSINEKRKQVVISSTLKNTDEGLPEYYEWLNVYNVSNDGTVEFVTKFCVKNDYAVYDYAKDEYAPLNLYLDSNGIIWHSRINEVKRFSIDKNEEIETYFELNDLYVIGIGEIDNNVVLFCYDYKERPVPISIFDTSLKEFSGDLPESVSFMVGNYNDPMKRLKATVRNNLLLISNENSFDQTVIYSTKPVIKILDCDCDEDEHTVVSPTGNKVAKFIGDARLVKIYLREGDKFNSIESHDCEDWYKNFWIDDDALLQIKIMHFRILDEKAPKFYRLPFKQGRDWDVTTVGKMVLIAEVVGQYPRRLSIYRMKML